MLTLHTCMADRAEAVADVSSATLPPDVVWIDLLNADAAEIAFVERATGLHVPSFDQLKEIETSSRLYTENGALHLSTPLVYRAQSDDPMSSPVGFILTPERLITIRFEAFTSFDSFKEHASKPGAVHRSSAGALVGLAEAIVDRMADVLERIGTELEIVSHRIFRAESRRVDKPHRPARESANLREVLRRVGRSGDLASKMRDSLLGTGRLVAYVTSLGAPWLPAEVKPRLATLKDDIGSLNDYNLFLTNKVQLLLDATLGLINIEQNNIIKVLTIVSVVGVPPTLVASMYGMNFKDMPELTWAWGYPYGLALIALSAIAPLLWFKLRGWL
jgi:magnesium transporter